MMLPLPWRDHAGQHRLAENVHRIDIDRERASPRAFVALENAALVDKTGAIEQHIERRLTANKGADSDRVSDIERECTDIFLTCCQRFQRSRIDVSSDYVRTLPGTGQCTLAADARAGRCNQHALRGETSTHLNDSNE